MVSSLLTYSLVEYIESEGSEMISGLNEIPEDVLLKHVVHAWQLAINTRDGH